MIRKLLIANRGEIAVRIIRTAREMGIATVAVYSEADRGSLHVRLADEAVFVGPSEPGASYLNMEAILAAARLSGADAVHPGYGFLSERDVFAEKVRAEGLTFVGPSPEAMRALGSKIEAKKLALDAGCPLVPGFFEPEASDEDLLGAARAMGMPVMLKASAGGGGRGMRAVWDEEVLEAELRLARDEAVKAFGDGAMMVEKLIPHPRHIEVQVLADGHGQVAALFERECSIQRRHQKLIEEAPSPVMTEGLWQRMREAALSLVRKAGYVGAGTVEFIADQEGENFYFLEVNARLQVEHPVTEMITGVDLVRQQLLIASGLPMDLPQAILEGDRRAIQGHSIECRIVAEDPAHGFLPSVGTIAGWAPPTGLGVRWDSGFEAGSEVTRFYDSLLAKLIVQGGFRSQAIQKMAKALEDTHILGVKTSGSFLREVVLSSWFEAGRFDTGALEREMPEWTPPGAPSFLGDLLRGPSSLDKSSPWAWDQNDSFRILEG